MDIPSIGRFIECTLQDPSKEFSCTLYEENCPYHCFLPPQESEGLYKEAKKGVSDN